jgi:hypothetical protein
VLQVHQECRNYADESSSIVVGILAGVVFLIPCVLAISYVLYKDRKIRKQQGYGAIDEEMQDDDDDGDNGCLFKLMSHQQAQANLNHPPGLARTISQFDHKDCRSGCLYRIKKHTQTLAPDVVSVEEEKHRHGVPLADAIVVAAGLNSAEQTSGKPATLPAQMKLEYESTAQPSQPNKTEAQNVKNYEICTTDVTLESNGFNKTTAAEPTGITKPSSESHGIHANPKDSVEASESGRALPGAPMDGDKHDGESVTKASSVEGEEDDSSNTEDPTVDDGGSITKDTRVSADGDENVNNCNKPVSDDHDNDSQREGVTMNGGVTAPINQSVSISQANGGPNASTPHVNGSVGIGNTEVTVEAVPKQKGLRQGTVNDGFVCGEGDNCHNDNHHSTHF